MSADNLPRVDWDAVCTCGHTFARHRTPGSECIECMGGEGDGCSWPLTGAECRAELYEAYRTRREITRERDALQRRMGAVRALCDGAISRSERVSGSICDVDFGFIKGCGALARDIRRLLDGEGDDAHE